MKGTLKKLLKFSLFGVLLFFAFPAHAVCPVCTVAVGAGVGLAQYFRIDDAITGIWIGGLIVSVTIWTISWMSRKNIRFFGRKILVAAGYIIFTLGPLYWNGTIGHPFNKLCGIDKLLLGTVVGGIFFILAVKFNDFLKTKNNGKVYFPFQKGAVPIITLGIISGIFYFLTC